MSCIQADILLVLFRSDAHLNGQLLSVSNRVELALVDNSLFSDDTLVLLLSIAHLRVVLLRLVV